MVGNTKRVTKYAEPPSGLLKCIAGIVLRAVKDTANPVGRVVLIAGIVTTPVILWVTDWGANLDRWQQIATQVVIPLFLLTFFTMRQTHREICRAHEQVLAVQEDSAELQRELDGKDAELAAKFEREKAQLELIHKQEVQALTRKISEAQFVHSQLRLHDTQKIAQLERQVSRQKP